MKEPRNIENSTKPSSTLWGSLGGSIKKSSGLTTRIASSPSLISESLASFPAILVPPPISTSILSASFLTTLP
ncbi:MAG: hypothetical protein ACP5KB_06120 [Thermoprotei archaeon]